MVDSFGTPDATTGQPIDPAGDQSVPAKGSFLSTTVGKLVVGGVALVLVLGALAAVFFVFILNKSGGPTSQVPVVPPAVTTATPEAVPTERPEIPLEDTFAFRNIFQPTIKITLTSEDTDGGTGAGTTDGEIPDIPPDTLFLMGVSTVDGEPVAELIWNGTVYSLEEGESIPDTPWEVLSIEGDTVVMLYGDARVTLTAGQGISK